MAIKRKEFYKSVIIILHIAEFIVNHFIVVILRDLIRKFY
jgi:hypothetical protein